MVLGIPLHGVTVREWIGLAEYLGLTVPYWVPKLVIVSLRPVMRRHLRPDLLVSHRIWRAGAALLLQLVILHLKQERNTVANLTNH